jgi:hypothetical protein
MRKRDQRNRKLTIEITKEDYDLLRSVRNRIFENEMAVWAAGGVNEKPKTKRLGEVLISVFKTGGINDANCKKQRE